jgi:peptidyl-prolyl cis-trans isomerase SurA
MSVNMSRSTALLLAVALGSATLDSIVEGTEVNRIVLRVNDRIATLYDYELAKQDRLAMLARAEMPEARKQEILATLGEAVMKDLFDEMLILSRADQLDIRVPEEEIDAAVEQTKASFGIETEEQFQNALISNQMTLAGLREQIERNLVIRKVFGREISPRIDLEESFAARSWRARGTRPLRSMRNRASLRAGSSSAGSRWAISTLSSRTLWRGWTSVP